MKGYVSYHCSFQRSPRRLVKMGLFWWVVLNLAYLAAPDTPVVLMAPRQPEETVSVCAIQGSGDVSPLAGQSVSTQGVVFADFETLPARGFYIQHQGCDGSGNTSDGIFVYTGSGANLFQSGDLVQISGSVQEYHGETEVRADPSGVAILSRGNPLPIPSDLVPPQDDQAAVAYLESLEGMHVRMDQALVLGPTDSAGVTWVIHASLGIERVFDDDPQGKYAIVAISDQGYFQLDAPAKVSDVVTDLQGALGGTDGVFKLHPLVQPELLPAEMPSELGVLPGSQGFTLATFNLANLFDSLDDPLTEDTVLGAAEYQRRLEKRALAIHEILAEPDILVVQEAENLSVLQALVNRPEIEAEYGIVWEESPDPRGLDIAVLYRGERAALLGYQAKQGCSGLIDGLGPDGNGDVENPANLITCDRDGDGILDGNRLFSRPPLAVELRIAVSPTGDVNQMQTIDVTVVANHWKSRLEDTNEMQYTLPRRIQQAAFTAALVQELQLQGKADTIVLAGDLNDVQGSVPISILKTAGMRDLTQQIERSDRYTQVYQGISQVIDYLMELPNSRLGAAQVQATHINADYPDAYAGIDGIVYRSSDHDPLWVNMIPLDEFIHLPVIYYGE